MSKIHKIRKIALIHAMTASKSPIEKAFKTEWPEVSIFNILDDSLPTDIGNLNEIIDLKFLSLVEYCIKSKADAALFTCSAFESSIALCKRVYSNFPIFGPYEGALQLTKSYGKKIAILASFEPTLESLPRLFSSDYQLEKIYVKGALQALREGNISLHNQIIGQTVKKIKNVDAILLAQYSMASAKKDASKLTNIPIITTPESNVSFIRQTL